MGDEGCPNENPSVDDATGYSKEEEEATSACLESTQQSKMDQVIPTWKLTVTDRRLMWLQKKHRGAHGHKLQLWAMGAFKEPSSPPLVSIVDERRDL